MLFQKNYLVFGCIFAAINLASAVIPELAVNDRDAVSYLEEQFLPLNHKLPYEPTQKGALNFKFVPSKDLPKTLLILLPGFKYQAYVDDEYLTDEKYDLKNAISNILGYRILVLGFISNQPPKNFEAVLEKHHDGTIEEFTNLIEYVGDGIYDIQYENSKRGKYIKYDGPYLSELQRALKNFNPVETEAERSIRFRSLIDTKAKEQTIRFKLKESQQYTKRAPGTENINLQPKDSNHDFVAILVETPKWDAYHKNETFKQKVDGVIKDWSTFFGEESEIVLMELVGIKKYTSSILSEIFEVNRNKKTETRSPTDYVSFYADGALNAVYRNQAGVVFNKYSEENMEKALKLEELAIQKPIPDIAALMRRLTEDFPEIPQKDNKK